MVDFYFLVFERPSSQRMVAALPLTEKLLPGLLFLFLFLWAHRCMHARTGTSLSIWWGISWLAKTSRKPTVDPSHVVFSVSKLPPVVVQRALVHHSRSLDPWSGHSVPRSYLISGDHPKRYFGSSLTFSFWRPLHSFSLYGTLSLIPETSSL